MSKIYTINNGKLESEKIPSMEYINELIKMIEDAINFNNQFNGFPSIKIDTEELPVGLKNKPIVSADEIVTDYQHKFINSAVLDTLTDKPSKFEVEQLLTGTKHELSKQINDSYMKIINTPNVINKLRDISTILNEDEIADGILNTLSYKVDREDFEEHNNSFSHIDNNDRKALNILIKCLVNGFADWNAEAGQYNGIKNKPESLPANGGNADTIANHSIKELINKDDYDIVIGRGGEKYSEDSCDIFSKDGNIDSNTLLSLVRSLSNVNTILFKRGKYNIDIIDSIGETIIYKGTDRRLCHITIGKLVNIYDSVFKHITFRDSTIYIGSECEIIDVCFINCIIVLNSCIDCNIIHCVFNNCEIMIKGSIMNNIIKFNRFIKTNPIVYIGGNNVISENI